MLHVPPSSIALPLRNRWELLGWLGLYAIYKTLHSIKPSFHTTTRMSGKPTSMILTFEISILGRKLASHVGLVMYQRTALTLPTMVYECTRNSCRSVLFLSNMYFTCFN
ncbi:hypothetical protein AVEN_189266-1 [Araneus ventricosus]|uniref:Uncharacterized protein n=1 Tax=Araneus ventricosus TaxID=182803 RepID=A0A4Y2LTN0_ARAVE|nr:hypothetical protein AVEN_189266-1 [Araneus ventricosus]